MEIREMSKQIQDEIDEEQDDGNNRIAWFLTGAAIGLTAAFLYAPKSGKETRQFITDKSQQGKQAVTESTKEIFDTSRDLFDRGRKLVEDAADLFDRGRRLMRG
jgi:gas vesicle protein